MHFTCFYVIKYCNTVRMALYCIIFFSVFNLKMDSGGNIPHSEEQCTFLCLIIMFLACCSCTFDRNSSNRAIWNFQVFINNSDTAQHRMFKKRVLETETATMSPFYAKRHFSFHFFSSGIKGCFLFFEAFERKKHKVQCSMQPLNPPKYWK